MMASSVFGEKAFAVGVAIGAPWFAAMLLLVWRRQARIVGFIASLVSAVASALLLQAAPAGESLYQALMLLYSCLTLGATLILPKRDCDRQTIGGILFLLGAKLFAYSTESLLSFLAGWMLSTMFAMATALYVAVRAVTENSPRRLLAFIALSQSACILAGLESRTSEGIAGALVHWFVVTVSTIGLFGILFSGPAHTRNADVPPGNGHRAPHRDGDECSQHFPTVRKAVSGQAAHRGVVPWA